MIEIRPQAGGQWEYFQRTEFEVLFGGAAGPGKSWALVIDALGLQFINTPLGKAAIEVPEYRAVLFRRKTTMLGQLIDEGKKYYTQEPFNAEYVAGRRGDPGPSFNFPSGARIFCCHMEQEDNKEDHQGKEYQFAGFDELTQFTITQYLYLFSRVRGGVKHLHGRMRGTTNPTGPGLMWVKKRFIKNGQKEFKALATYWFVPDSKHTLDENPTGVMVKPGTPKAKSRCFIPGRLAENKVLQEMDPDYDANIMAMGKKYEAALLHGDWDAFSGDFFEDFGGHLKIEPFKIPKQWYLCLSVDPGWSSPCSVGLSARDFEGNIYRLFTYYQRNRSAAENANGVLQMLKQFPFTAGRMPDIIVSGNDAFAKKDRHAIMANDLTFADVWRDAGLVLQPAKTDRVLGWMAWKQLMRENRWFAFEHYNEALFDEIISAEHDDKDPEDIRGRGNDPEVVDHALDECRYGIMAMFQPTKGKKRVNLAEYKEDYGGADPETPAVKKAKASNWRDKVRRGKGADFV